MSEPKQAQDAPIRRFKRTKIVATVGPSTNSYKKILELVKAGANGIRLNFSHGSNEERERHIEWIRQASRETGKPVAIIQDLQGPKMRLGDFDNLIEAQQGETLTLALHADYEHTGDIPTQFDLSEKVKPGERLYISDGKIKTTVTEVLNKKVYVKVLHGGVLIRRKGINLPDTDFGGDIITTKDKEDIAFGSTHDVDYVALSFVQSADDIRKLRRRLAGLGSKARIIAKIETKKSIDNLEEIIVEADAVMIARGDLATETSPESVPVTQRKIIELGKKYARPTIVATQLLASMTMEPEPTRAEVSDVATATILGADAIMLSDETAIGKYPVESIKVMKRVINYTQKNTPEPIMTNFADVEHSRQKAISQAVIGLSREMSAVAIVAETKSGATAIQISSNRPEVPVIAVTSSERVAQQLAIVYGTKSYIRPDDKLQATKLTNWLLKNSVLAQGDVVVTASGRQPGAVGTTDTIKIRIL
ncbi:MAG TPA: pyruvate kinase [Candidatus Saccharimonadales bacterium]|nr:pyruvate kinase [Candidatus Saccharimonadales bacterium]